MKDLPYITHDFGARNDPKLMDLQMDMGGQGLGIFWCLVEMLWENGGTIPANYKSIAFALRWCKAAEVEKVVTGYGLFEVQGGYLYSHSASARINEMRTKFGARSESNRKASAARWSKRTDSERNADAMQTECGCNANAMRTDSERNADGIPLTNILTNKQTNSINRPLTAADFYETFFFSNVKDPGAEVHRFWNYYEERDWTYQDGTPVTDVERAAKDWKPAKAGPRWDSEALRWYQAVWNAAKSRIENAQDPFLCQLTHLSRKGQRLALRFRSEGAARTVAVFIADNDLAGDWQIEYRIEN